jgi:protease-4
MLRLRDEGKQTCVLLPRGGGHREVYIASAADRIYLAPQSTVTLLGLSAEAHYMKPMLDRIGVEVEPFARKEYKTAAERLSRESMSEPQREQVQALIDGHTAALLDALSQRIGTTPEQTRALFEAGVFRGQNAIDARLVDALAYEDELPEKLGLRDEKKNKTGLIEGGRYLSFKEARLFRPLRREPYIAVVTVKGAISESGAPMGRRASIVAALRQAREDRQALGVLLWVDSPGGSAEASDLIHREVVRVREKKPVVAYFGEVAASGGYYVAAHANAIVAQPLGLTGSIGVVSARLLASQLLDRVGVRTEVLRTGPHADMHSPHRRLTDEERGLMNRELDAFYESFVALVADGRGRTVEEIEPLARGRVWLAADAHRHGLVDRLGGMDQALEVLKDTLEVPPRLRERLRPMVMSSYRLEPPPPAALLRLDGSVFEGLRDLAVVLSESPAVLYHAVSVPRIR